MASKEELFRAIHENCMDCCGGSRKLVKNCKVGRCPLWPYRTSERARSEGEIEGQMTVFQLLAKTGT